MIADVASKGSWPCCGHFFFLVLSWAIDEGEDNEGKDNNGRCPSEDDEGAEVWHVPSACSAGDAATIKAAVMVKVNNTALTC